MVALMIGLAIERYKSEAMSCMEASRLDRYLTTRATISSLHGNPLLHQQRNVDAMGGRDFGFDTTGQEVVETFAGQVQGKTGRSPPSI